MLQHPGGQSGLVGLFDACSACGGKPVHKLGGRMLTQETGAMALLFGSVTLCLVLWSVAGGPVASIPLGVALTVFFAGYWFLSSRRGRTGPT